MVSIDNPEKKQGQGGGSAGVVVMASGLFGTAAAGIMYLDSSSRGEEFLQDSLLLISSAAILGIATFIFGLYLYIKSN
jgi:hypothetical protein